MADVRYNEVTNLVPSQQVPPSESAEGHGEIRAGLAVNHPGQQVNTGGPIDGHNGNLEVEQAGEEGGHLGTRCAGGAGAKQRIDREANTGPGPVGTHFPDPLCTREPGHSLAQLRTRAR